jgi:hypothetical protein
MDLQEKRHQVETNKARNNRNNTIKKASSRGDDITVNRLYEMQTAKCMRIAWDREHSTQQAKILRQICTVLSLSLSLTFVKGQQAPTICISSILPHFHANKLLKMARWKHCSRKIPVQFRLHCRKVCFIPWNRITRLTTERSRSGKVRYGNVT